MNSYTGSNSQVNEPDTTNLNFLKRIDLWTDEGNINGEILENPAKSETFNYLTVVVEYRYSDIRQPQLSIHMFRT